MTEHHAALLRDIRAALPLDSGLASILAAPVASQPMEPEPVDPVLPQATGTIVVKLFPCGVPGQVIMTIHDIGRVPMTRAEQIRTLRQAIETLEGEPG